MVNHLVLSTDLMCLVCQMRVSLERVKNAPRVRVWTLGSHSKLWVGSNPPQSALLRSLQGNTPVTLL